MRRALLVGLSICAAGALAYLVTLLLELRAATAPPTPTAFVQAAWSVYRFGPGHVFHTGQLHLDCSACHRTEVSSAFDRPGPNACVGCHENKAQIEHAMVELDPAGVRQDGGAERAADCVRCHGFGPDPEQKATDCLACHRGPHGDMPAIVTHAENPCRDCHDVHANRTAPARCTECHSVVPSHGATDVPVASQCLACHDAHGSAKQAVERCRDCHRPDAQRAPVPESATPPGHACTGCHQAHDFRKQQAVACASCHADVHPLAAASHRDCTGCHSPHAVVQSVAAPQDVCLTCHAKVALRHAEQGKPASACTSCHPAHPTAAEGAGAHATRACAACHAEVGEHGIRGHGGELPCTTCHTPHDFVVESGAGACAKCHAKQLARTRDRPGHATCTECHQGAPHATDLSAGSCTACHKQIHASDGHATCTQCHDAHAGAPRTNSCAGCHAQQVDVQLHQTQRVACLTCHDPHRGDVRAGVADCSSCHTRTRLAGLHEVKEHAPCASCHLPHERRAPGARETCLSCHEDKRAHQPEATRCEGCHQFELAARGRRP
jgi:hypothetical protein